jgi:hypothetical protein
MEIKKRTVPFRGCDRIKLLLIVIYNFVPKLWDEFIILKVILSNPLNQLIAVKQIFTIKKRR